MSSETGSDSSSWDDAEEFEDGGGKISNLEHLPFVACRAGTVISPSRSTTNASEMTSSISSVTDMNIFNLKLETAAGEVVASKTGLVSNASSPVEEVKVPAIPESTKTELDEASDPPEKKTSAEFNIAALEEALKMVESGEIASSSRVLDGKDTSLINDEAFPLNACCAEPNESKIFENLQITNTAEVVLDDTVTNNVKDLYNKEQEVRAMFNKHVQITKNTDDTFAPESRKTSTDMHWAKPIIKNRSLLQDCQPSPVSIWTLDFNKRGNLLALAGEDAIVYVYTIAGSSIDNELAEKKTAKDKAKPIVEDGLHGMWQVHVEGKDKKEAFLVEPTSTAEVQDLKISSALRTYTVTNQVNIVWAKIDFDCETKQLVLTTTDLNPKKTKGIYDSEKRGITFVDGTDWIENKQLFESVSQNINVMGRCHSNAPFREWKGHQAAILSLAWSTASGRHKDLLLSASLDNRVILWHPRRAEALAVYQHPEFCTGVTWIPFLPDSNHYESPSRTDNHQDSPSRNVKRFSLQFMTSCFDCRVRVWSVEQHSVVSYRYSPNVISALAVSPNGKYTAVGLLDSKVELYYFLPNMTFSMGFKTVQCKNRRKNSKFSKVTGIEFLHSKRNNEFGATHILATTNDSYIWLIDLSTFEISCKFKGVRNERFYICATLSHGNEYVIMGGNGPFVNIWQTNDGKVEAGWFKTKDYRRKNSDFCAFKVTDDNSSVVVAKFMPERTLKYIRNYLEKQGVASGNNGFTLNDCVIVAESTGKLKCIANVKEQLPWKESTDEIGI